mgnify:CR=1 FL=1|tara:strand:- start:45 stop:1529 length:1485 start_codon:yes stop_codon:yes gene_type:complete
MIINLCCDQNLNQIKGCILTYGHFSTIHPGHIRYLKHAKSLGDKLVIALIGDESESNFPFTQKERAEALETISIADEIVALKGSNLCELINKINPKIIVLGNEYQNSKHLKEAIKLQKSLGGKVKFHAGDIHYAAADLLGELQHDVFQKRKSQFLDACKRQNITLNKLLDAIDKWKNNKLVVIGDTIVDQYAACEAIGMSAEAPVVVVRELEKKNFIGGAAIVASHIRALGAQCDLVSVVGEDNTADLVKETLIRQEIGEGLITDPARPTTFKKRYVVENQKLFRVTRMKDHNLSRDKEDEIISRIELLAPEVNGIVISDFVYGVVTQRILDRLQELSKKYNFMLFGDLQCSSQVGSVLKFKNFKLLCPNEREARIALQDKDSSLEQISNNILDLTNCDNLIMKLGSEGFIAYEREIGGYIKRQSFPALSVNPLDVAGAGDSLLALMATAISSGQPLMSTAALGSCIASIAVETMGNSPINFDTLRLKITEILN